MSAPHAELPAVVSGQVYLRLAVWAKAHGLELRWLKQDETLQLTNHSSKIVLAVDSREAQINGVAVWLLFPLVAHNGAI